MAKTQKSRIKGKLRAWMHLVDGFPDRVFLTNPSTKTYGEYRKTLKGIYGKASQVVECKVIYSVGCATTAEG